MGIMTGDAVSALFHVHMEKMQVVLAITETGQGLGVFLFGDILVMAAKAEGIILRPVFFIEFFGVVTTEKTAELRAVHLMTGHTVAGLHRAVAVLAARNVISQLFMAGKTQILGCGL